MIKLLKRLDKKDIIYAIICIIFIILQVWLDLKMPDYMSQITVLVQTEGSKMQDILINGGYMVLCALGSFAFAVIAGYLAATISSNFSRNLRKEIFDKVKTLTLKKLKVFQLVV